MTLNCKDCGGSWEGNMCSDLSPNCGSHVKLFNHSFQSIYHTIFCVGSSDASQKQALQLFGLLMMFMSSCFFFACMWTEIKLIHKMTYRSYSEMNSVRTQLLLRNCGVYFLLKAVIHAADILPCFLGGCSIGQRIWSSHKSSTLFMLIDRIERSPCTQFENSWNSWQELGIFVKSLIRIMARVLSKAPRTFSTL